MTFKYTIGTILIIYALIATAIMLLSDLYLVLYSYGSWGVFGEKLVMSFITMIAFIATINGKVGINTQWLNKENEGNEGKVSKFIFINIVLSIIILILINIFEKHENKVHILEDTIVLWIWLSIFGLLIWIFSGLKIINKISNKRIDKHAIEKDELTDEISPYSIYENSLIKHWYEEGRNYESASKTLRYMYDVEFSRDDYLDIGKNFVYKYSFDLRYSFIARSYLMNAEYETVSLKVESLFHKKLYKEDYIKLGEKVKKKMSEGKSFGESIPRDWGIDDYAGVLIIIIFIGSIFLMISS